MISFKTSSVILCALLAVSGSLVLSTEAQAECKAEVVGPQTKGTVRNRVEARARRQWEDKASSTYGSSFGNWDKAQNKSMKCEWDSGNFILTSNVCRARGRPCN